MKNFIQSLNLLHTDIMGFVLVLVGAVLMILNRESAGRELVVGGFALITGGRANRSTDGGATKGGPRLDGK